ncbi:Uncharacterised protein [Rikenella microfusus]|uniref:Uncharacterized protein n=1 Tax=Rikenella microfusus TaxID=28139 RepID=A0A379MTT9_9BACT|nr:Uncharacterised protein [Rikenella microfusus]
MKVFSPSEGPTPCGAAPGEHDEYDEHNKKYIS